VICVISVHTYLCMHRYCRSACTCVRVCAYVNACAHVCVITCDANIFSNLESCQCVFGGILQRKGDLSRHRNVFRGSNLLLFKRIRRTLLSRSSVLRETSNVKGQRYVHARARVCVPALLTSSWWPWQCITEILCGVANDSSSGPCCVVETRQGQGALELVLQANKRVTHAYSSCNAYTLCNTKRTKQLLRTTLNCL